MMGVARSYPSVVTEVDGRLKSLDIFRGATIAAMIVVNNPGSREDSYAQLLHATWNGWTFADTIFPFFLWIVGVALALSTRRRFARGETRRSLLTHALRRSVLLFTCGVLVGLVIFPTRTFPHVAFANSIQLTGVLQKIGVCYLAAFLIFVWSSSRAAILAVAGLNLVYLGFICFYPVPGCGAGVLTPQCNFAGYVDRVVLSGYMWGNAGMQDPDGLGSILPAISTVLLGALAGNLLRPGLSQGQRVSRLIIMGFGLVAASSLLALQIPFNKILWTTSYALLMAGLAALCFSASYWVVDVLGWWRWGKFLEIFGMNSIAAYVISRIGANVPKVHFWGKSLYKDVCLQICNAPNASLLFAVVNAAGVFLVVWWMYHRRWFVKL